jgi:hypothetical protein
MGRFFCTGGTRHSSIRLLFYCLRVRMLSAELLQAFITY